MAGMANSITDYIGIVKVDGSEYLTGSTLFGTCTTAADEAAKKVVIEEITNFTPTHGLTIHVLFTHTNTAASPTLQFSSESTATTYPIYAYGDSPVGNTMSTSWHDNAIVSFTFYDGALDATATAKRWIMNSGTDTGADGMASVNLANVNYADDLKAIEALVDTSGYLKKTAANTWTLQTTTDATSSVAGITTVGSTSGGAAAYNHTHGNITNDGKMSGSTVARAGSATDKFLREDGTWIEPAYTTNTDTKVKQTATTSANDYTILFSESTNSSGTTTLTEGARKHNLLRYNPGAHTLSIGDGNGHTGTLTATQYSGNAATATTAAAAPWNGISDTPTTLGGYGITDAKIDNGVITLGSNTITPVTKVNNKTGSSITLTASDLGLAAALRFIGAVDSNSSYKPNEDGPGTPKISGKDSYTPSVGDVVLDADGNAEYVCVSDNNSTYTWELLGRDSSFALSTEVINKSIFNKAYQLLYSSGASSATVLDPNTTSTRKFLRMVGNGSAGASPEWDTVTKTDVGLENVENIKLSTWTGSNKITTLGTITTGTWHGTTIEAAYIGEHSTDKLTSGTLGVARGGTGFDTYTTGDILYASGTTTLSKLSVGSNPDGYVLTLNNNVPVWAANSATDEKVALQAITTTTTATNYYAILSSTSTPTAASTRLYNTSIAFNLIKGSTSSTGSGYSTLILGNNTNKGNANNLTGRIRLYGFSTSYTDIVGAPVASAQTLTLPSVTGGNLVGTSTTGKVGDTNKPVYINANGVATAIDYTIEKNVPSTAVFTDTTYTPTADTTIYYLSDANYVKTASVSNGILTITAVTNASSITPITAITPSVAGPTS